MAESKPSTLLNALIGAVATVALSFTLVSPILGGAIAGYLERERGARVGAISGIIASIPVVLLGLLAVGTIPMIGASPRAIGLLVVPILLLLVPLYLIGSSALGGYLGVYLRDEVG